MAQSNRWRTSGSRRVRQPIPDIQQVASGDQPKRNKREADRNAGQGESHGVGFRYRRYKPFASSNKDEPGHDEDDCNEQPFNSGRQGVVRELLFRCRWWRGVWTSRRLRRADRPFREYLVLTHSRLLRRCVPSSIPHPVKETECRKSDTAKAGACDIYRLDLALTHRTARCPPDKAQQTSSPCPRRRVRTPPRRLVLGSAVPGTR